MRCTGAALVLSLTLVGANPPAAGQEQAWTDPISAERRRAVDRAYRCLAENAAKPRVLSEYGSDFLLFFYEIKACAASPRLRRRAAKDGAALARRLIARFKTSERAGLDQLREAIVLLALVKDFGLQSEARALRARVRSWRRSFTPADLHELERGQEARSAEELCDALIGLHFLRRAGLEDDGALSWVLELCARKSYPAGAPRSDDERVAHDNLATHVIYVMSDYGRLRLDQGRYRPEMAYARLSSPRCRKSGDIEGVAEFTDTLRILGIPDGDETMAANIRWILRRQNPDGSFGPIDADFYERYHTTWTALNALRAFRFQGQGPLWKSWRRLRPLKDRGG